ncbi:MAG: hypothetical protein U5L96_21240 [Owenweeksia sp.]|nr:hypothetical protein [Owenweeksia sp.]
MQYALLNEETMNKLLLLTAGLLMGIGQVQAQCTPDTTITDLLVPPAGSRYDTVGGEPIVILPYAQAYQSYSEVLQFKVPKDTMVFNLQGVVDSVRLLKVINLPPTLTMNCNPTGCKFIGGDYGCAEMSGIPQVPDSVEIRVAIEYWIRVRYGQFAHQRYPGWILPGNAW